MFRPLLLLFALPLFAQQKPFVATAKIGVPCVVGHETWMDPTTKIETGTLREVTLQSAELALTFPNRHENVVATAAEKLLILRGTIRNPEKTTTDNLSASSVVGLRVWQRYTGSGKFTFVNHYDPETLKQITVELKPGASAPFIGVFAGEARDPSKHRYVVTATVTNRLLLPIRWGWQYMTTELVDAAGRAVKAYPDIIDRATMRSWSGDLNAGASMQAAFVFYSPTPVTSRALRQSFNASGRTVEAALTR